MKFNLKKASDRMDAVYEELEIKDLEELMQFVNNLDGKFRGKSIIIEEGEEAPLEWSVIIYDDYVE